MLIKGPRRLRYALLMYNADEQQINGTATPLEFGAARRFARSVLRLSPHVASIDMYAYDTNGQLARQALARVDWDQEWDTGEEEVILTPQTRQRRQR